MTSLLLVTTLLLSAPELLLLPLDGPTPPDEDSAIRRIALSAAANEREHFRVQIRNDETPRTLQGVSIDWVGPLETLVTAWRVELPERPNPAIKGLEPLTLLIGGHEIAANATLDLILAVHVGESAPSGTHTGEVRFAFSEEKPLTCSIQLEIFAFSLPGVPSLPIVFGLDQRRPLAPDDGPGELDYWAPTYDTLAGLRTGFSVWPVRDAVPDRFYDYSDLDLVKEHLTYALRTARLPALEIGGTPGELLRQWPPPVGNAPQDPLQLLLHNLTTHLQSMGWLQPTVLTTGPIPERAHWEALRGDLARIGRADETITRLISGPLHPYFERYTDLWALPADTPAAAMSLLGRGLSTIRFAPVSALSISGTSGAAATGSNFATEAADALDGCEFSRWRVPGREATLEVTFNEPRRIEQLAFIWPGEAPKITTRVQTAYNEGSFSEATIRWEASAVLSEGEGDISLGVFKHPRECRSIRLTLRREEGEGIDIGEILFNQDGRNLINVSVDPVTPWLDLRATPNPWLDSDPTGNALRMLPWYCWQRNMKGVLGPVLGGDWDASALFVSGPLGLRPTRRMLQLLDGMEDVEYLILYGREVAAGNITPPRQNPPGRIALPGPRSTEGRVKAAWEALAQARLDMGRQLSGKPIVSRNFGP